MFFTCKRYDDGRELPIGGNSFKPRWWDGGLENRSGE